MSAPEFTFCPVYGYANACMTYVSCNKPFFCHLQDQNLTLYHNNPDLTECFQLSVLPWIPCFYLWVVFPFYYIYLKLNNRGYIMMSILNRIKTVRVAAVCRNYIWELRLAKSFTPPSSISTKHSLDDRTFNTTVWSHTNHAFCACLPVSCYILYKSFLFTYTSPSWILTSLHPSLLRSFDSSLLPFPRFELAWVQAYQLWNLLPQSLCDSSPSLNHRFSNIFTFCINCPNTQFTFIPLLFTPSSVDSLVILILHAIFILFPSDLKFISITYYITVFRILL